MKKIKRIIEEIKTLFNTAMIALPLVLPGTIMVLVIVLMGWLIDRIAH